MDVVPHAHDVQVSLDVVGTGSDGTESSVVFSIKKHGVYSDDETVVKRYMFNCGEGTQRLCNENGLKLGSLTSMFLTRLDPLTCSGIPGMILALGGCGTPDLSIAGPGGTHAFVTSTKSFARRNYPVITCTEVDVKAQSLTSSHINHATVNTNDPIVEDRHVRITPLSMRQNQSAARHPASCRQCLGVANQPTNTDRSSAPTVVSRPVVAQDQPMLEWLKAFYEAKDPSKVPYVQVILNKYQGRQDDLKRMLVTKYGPLAPESSSDDSSEDDEDVEPPRVNEDSTSSSKNSTPNVNVHSKDDSDTPHTKEASTPTSSPSRHATDEQRANDLASSSSSDEESEGFETWLRHFYTRHNPSMVPRLQSVLHMYAGREDQLKAMLQQKYVSAKRPLDDDEASTTTVRGDGPDTKKTKSDRIDCMTDVYVTPPAAPRPSTIQHDQILCYILEFKGSPNTIAWVVDIPDESWLSHVTSLLSSCPAHRPALVVHMTPSSLATQPTYVSWVKDHTSSATRHLVFDGQLLDEFDHGACGFTFVASAHLRLQLHAASSSLFPLSRPFHALATSTSAHHSRLVIRAGDGTSFHVAQPGLMCQLTVAKARQKVGFHHRQPPSSHSVPPQPFEPPNDHSYAPKLTFLGTGSAAPSKLRNSSAIYLEETASTGMLIDCGEGTFGQLWRQFGPSTPSRLCSLKCIWVSHKHADHHCGLLRVLLERHRAFAHSRMPVAPIVIIAPDAVLAYVARWQAAWLTGVSMVSCTDFNHPQHALRPMVLHLTGFLNMWSVPVHHCHDSYGLVLVTRAGMKLVYSGDTRPCDRLIHEGFRPHVLIHEATFEDSMHDDAIRKKHSTVGEALNVGRRMQAHLVLLTHFSQRYPKLPPRQATGGEGSCGFAFDGMQVILDAPDPDPYHPQYLQPSLPPPGSVHSRDSIEVTLASFMSAVRNEATAAIASPPSP
ncbi:hypothetical protein H310_06802 [Aphanomyces invadans]|uniref:ribonuclease Z n=1 Tax=Aphanomyces invadans TaxID=157072 RepID=A0A024U6H0_9STRA|nr:hypothetical protein H310_06802 [Aphanomyces invadans]ETW01213.1 hypothetical protein H310_06802 [Aphanomyces invadans]|eukprot:XP_008870211.1 hypothetical protein H310_06802 [Aphanomyces invadans]